MPTSKAEGEVLITIAIDEQLKSQVRSQAALQGRTFKEVLDEALRRWLKEARRGLGTSPVRSPEAERAVRSAESFRLRRACSARFSAATEQQVVPD